jgi:hypothetical protein
LVDELQLATLSLSFLFLLRTTGFLGPLLPVKSFTFFDISEVRSLSSFSLFI